MNGNFHPTNFHSMFGLILPPEWPGAYAVAPTMPYPIVRLPPGKRVQATLARWGLVPAMYHGVLRKFKPSTFNARSEDAQQRPSFTLAYQEARRCLVLVQSFYEWSGEPEKRQAYEIQRADGRPLVLGGLWETWIGEFGPLETFTLLACPANALVSQLHDRQPVILERSNWRAWLDPRTPERPISNLMQPCAHDVPRISPASSQDTRPMHKRPAEQVA
ncbi:SOS response-associated peptidase [Deinococcus peraridilitoris]|uniref:SOS response-associated peptidase n=1 Tax=Deinococcus peraridilitoris TaxID=432329 RepID=UPI001FDFB603|nr:SOS response-associated peptidase [Deinococcus peraridilitoris]